MKILLAVFCFIAACNAKALRTTGFDELESAVAVQASVDNNEVIKSKIILAEKGAILSSTYHKNGIVEAEGSYKGITIGGDTIGQYHASADLNPLRLEAKRNQAGDIDYAAKLQLPAINAVVTGNKNGLQNYDMHSSVGGIGLRVNGDVHGVDTNYEANVGLALIGDSKNYDYSLDKANGLIGLNVKANNRNYKGVDGILWIGPIGAEIDYDNQGKLIYTAHLNVANMVSGKVVLNSVTKDVLYNIGLQVVLDKMSLILEGNADKAGIINTSANLFGYGVHLHAEQNKQGQISGGLLLVKSGYGIKIDGNKNMQFEVGLVLNNQNGVIPIGTI